MMTWVTPIAVNMTTEISPVNAPSFSQWTFCAPTATLEPLRGFDGGVQINKRRADDDLVARVVGDHGQEFAEECGGLFRRLVHLPVGGDKFFTCHGLVHFQG